MASLAEFIEQHESRVLQVVLSSLGPYTALSDQQAVRRLLIKALESDKFLRSFTAAVVKASAATWGPQESFVLLTWSSLVATKLTLPDAKKAVDRLLESQVRACPSSDHLLIATGHSAL